MLSISAVQPLNKWDNFYIQPGGVAPVGDALVQTRLQGSYPEQTVIFQKRNIKPYGSNVVDGNNEAMYRISAGPRVFDSSWGVRKSQKVSHGWRIEDLRTVDRMVQPLMGSSPMYDWQNKVATAYKTTGSQFLPMPGGYQSKGGLSRGPTPITYLIGSVQEPAVIPGQGFSRAAAGQVQNQTPILNSGENFTR